MPGTRRWFWTLIVTATLALSAGCVVVNPVADFDTSSYQTAERYSESLEKVVDGAGLARLSAQTTNGAVTVRAASQPAVTVRITKEVRNALALPVGFSGELDARTSNGRVSSSLTVKDPSLSTKTRLVGRLGEGGAARISLTTSNGNVELRPGGQP
jgi:hypothetical protein